MAKPKQPKPEGQASSVETPPSAADALMSLPNASTLLDEVQQRCESLRQWQRDAQAPLQERSRVVERREKELDETQKTVEVGRSKLELDQDALRRARLMFDKERAQHEQSQQALESEKARLDRDRAELVDQKQELQSLREELDTEWASLARVRRAQEALVAALENERTRIQELRASDDLSGMGAEANEADTENGPGLSLTQAA